MQELGIGGRWFDPRLSQYSVRGLTIVLPTYLFLSHRCPLYRQFLCGKAASGLERILCKVVVKELHGSIDRCTGRYYITEILLKTACNTRQSINQSIDQSILIYSFKLKISNLLLNFLSNDKKKKRLV